MVTRFALLKALSSVLSDDVLVVASIGNNSGFWGQLKERESNLFHITLGMCTPTALGLALALPNRKVVALDADGNLILNLGVLGTVANENPRNLTVIVMDNRNYLGSHKNEPGMPTATAGKMNLEGVAKASGIRSASTARNVGQFHKSVKAALARKGPHLIVAKIASLDNDRPARARRLPDPRENKYRFAAYIERTERAEILGSGLGGG
ncbi:MAG TPA: thiamine pyrophosphate-dependent enzyme [Candidatus Binatia bacterium]|jgi:thiamine pyrophosphate-dependent acetolactate synthase large subunit-like protein